MRLHSPFAAGTIGTADLQATTAPAPRASIRDRWPWVEWFVCVQFLWGALLFIPDAQPFRPIIRALPYASSLGMLLLYFPQRSTHIKAPGSASFLLAALAVLVTNLLHPTTQFVAGVAQCVFQLMIAAPAFWAWKAVRDEKRLLKVIRLVFLLNVISASVGSLQVYFPAMFLPPQFSSLGMQLSSTWVEELSYEGANGRTIVRPPGLTDQPGAASVAGAITAVLGLGLTLLSRGTANRVLGLGGAGLGLFVLYLTQVRSLLLMCVAAFIVMAALMFRRGRFAAGTWLLTGGAALVLSAFFWAVSVGGERVEQRFTDIAQRGAMETYRENRGHFLSYTLGELLDAVPARRRRRPVGHDVHLLRQPCGSRLAANLRGDPTDRVAPRRGRASLGVLRRGPVRRVCDGMAARQPALFVRHGGSRDDCPARAADDHRNGTGRTHLQHAGGLAVLVSRGGAVRRGRVISSGRACAGTARIRRPHDRPFIRIERGDAMTRATRVFGGVGLGQVHLVLATLVGLWLTPVLLARVGAEQYGLWLVGLQLLGYLYLLDLGVVGLLPRETAYASGRVLTGEARRCWRIPCRAFAA